jgi:hypothetical protein
MMDRIKNAWRSAPSTPTPRADEKATYETMRERLANAWKESK